MTLREQTSIWWILNTLKKHNRKRLRHPCRKCGKYFRPNTRVNKVCIECKDNINFNRAQGENKPKKYYVAVSKAGKFEGFIRANTREQTKKAVRASRYRAMGEMFAA